MRSENLLIYHGETFNPNFYYLSGLTLTNAFLIVEGSRKTIVTNALNQGLGHSFKGEYVVAKDIVKEVKGRIRSAGIDGKMPAHLYLKLKGSVRMRDMSEELYAIRMVKKPAEVSAIRTAARLTRDIIGAVRPREGQREREIANRLLAETYRRGLEPAFQPIVATGRNAATPHAIPTEKKIQDYVLIDYGVRWNHYCADITRCFFFKGAKAKRIAEIYGKVRKLAYEIIDNSAGLRKSREAAAVYEKINRAYCLPKPLHSLGHGVGLDVHEYPRFGKKYNDPLLRTTFSVEPAAYFSDFGVRYEETVFHNGRRIEVL